MGRKKEKNIYLLYVLTGLVLTINEDMDYGT